MIDIGSNISVQNVIGLLPKKMLLVPCLYLISVNFSGTIVVPKYILYNFIRRHCLQVHGMLPIYI